MPIANAVPSVPMMFSSTSTLPGSATATSTRSAATGTRKAIRWSRVMRSPALVPRSARPSARSQLWPASGSSSDAMRGFSLLLVAAGVPALRRRRPYNQIPIFQIHYKAGSGHACLPDRTTLVHGRTDGPARLVDAP